MRIFDFVINSFNTMGNLILFFRKVADGLQAEGNFGTAHVYRSTLNAVIRKAKWVQQEWVSLLKLPKNTQIKAKCGILDFPKVVK